jgi:hypothetical protein
LIYITQDIYENFFIQDKYAAYMHGQICRVGSGMFNLFGRIFICRDKTGSGWAKSRKL